MEGYFKSTIKEKPVKSRLIIAKKLDISRAQGVLVVIYTF
jgi:hypothetical protein